MSNLDTWDHQIPVDAAQVMVDNASIRELSAGFHFDTHMHRSVEIIVCLAGSSIVTVQNVPIEVHPMEYLVVFPNVLHHTDIPETMDCKFLQMHFHDMGIPKAIDMRPPANELSFTFELSLNKRKFLKGRSTPQMEACIAGVSSELAMCREGSERMLACYMQQLNVLLSRDLSSRTDGGRIYENRYLVNATLYINEHYMEKLTVSGIAAAAGVSSRYMTRLFQEQFNLGMSTYITYVRISKSIDYMFANPQYPLTDLALDMGFSSQQHFSKVFKEKMGLPPRKYFAIRPISSS